MSPLRPPRLHRSWSLRGSALSALAAASLSAGCGENAVTPPPQAPLPAAVALSVTSVTLDTIGQTVQVTATVRDRAGGNLAAPVTWTTEHPSVATVSSSGAITAVGNGSTTVKATAGSVAAPVAVTVRQIPARVTITPDTATLIRLGASVTLLATVHDGGGTPITDATVAWTSSALSVATVSPSGTVTAVAAGSTTITATAAAAAGTATVTVAPTPVAQVRILAPAELHEHETAQLTGEVIDTAGRTMAGAPIAWFSDSTHVATIDAGGLARGVKTGVARFRARAGGVEAAVTLPVRGLIHRWSFTESGGPGTVFRDDVRGARASIVRVGPQGASAAGGQVTLAGGAKDQADYVALPAGVLSGLRDASIEVWATLHSRKWWSRVFDAGSSTANNLFIAWSQGADPLTDRTGFAVNGAEQRVDNVLAPFTLDLQHHVVLVVDEGGGAQGRTRLSVYLDGSPRGSFETSYRLADLVDANFWLGRSHYGDETAHASYDEVRIHDRALRPEGVEQAFHQGPVRDGSPPVALAIGRPAGMGDTVRGVGVQFRLRPVGRDALGRQFPVPGGQWSSSNPAVATVDAEGTVRTLAAGETEISVSAGGLTARWTAAVVRVRRVTVDPYLATPMPGALWEVPVVLIEYLPTADGANLDVHRAPDYWSLNPQSLDAMEAQILTYARRRKMMVEQGSRFRGYRDPAALPSLGYRVIEHLLVYDQIPPHPTKRAGNPGQPRFEDWHAVIRDLALEPLMRARQVRELWVAWSSFDGSFPTYDPARFNTDDMRAGWESNMASPTTGDISNSDRDPADAPILGHTYIIYGLNFRRTQAEAVHNVGHQLEAMLAYISTRQTGNSRLFWRDFVGQDAQGNFVTGRAGWTHMPPNTTAHYDYRNPTLVSSDIEDWQPGNAGQKTMVNVDRWGGLTYPWPGEADFAQRVESQWYTYWFQSFPGRGNRIPYGASWMTNWWAFVADWDSAVRTSLGLYAATPAASVGAAGPYQYPAPSAWATVPEPRR